MNLKDNNTTLSLSQKKRIIQWEIPHLIVLLKKQWKLSFIHLNTQAFSLFSHKAWFILQGKLCFPLFAGGAFLGLLVCFRGEEHLKNFFTTKKTKLKTGVSSSYPTWQIRRLIDDYLEQVLEEKDTLLEEVIPLKNSVKNLLKKSRNKEFFPLLLRQNTKLEFLKTAHNLYLKSSSFAFLNTEDLSWEKGVFQEMKGVFVCVPSFQSLSGFQKQILKKALLKKRLVSPLVMGLEEKEKLPKEWSELFPFVL